MKHIVLVISIVFIFFACNTADSGSGTVYMQLQVPGQSQSLTRIHESVPVGIELITVGITGLVEPVSLDMDTLELTMEVPAGRDREFVAKAYSSDNVLAYQGSTVADINSGKETVVSLIMQPVGQGDQPDTPDTTAPTITTFALTSPATVANPSITFTLEGTDDVGITGWLINETATAPASTDAAWTTALPTSYAMSSAAGTKTIYAWAKDAAGNISGSQSATVTLVAQGTIDSTWTKIVDGGSGDDTAYDTALDSAGNLYVVGRTYVTLQNNNWFIKKYDANGVEITTGWNKTFDGSMNLSDEATSVAIDTNNNVYVVGYTDEGTVGQNYNWWIKKFSSDGTEITSGWNKTFDSGMGNDSANCVAIDKADNSVYVVGYKYNSGTNKDWWIKKFTSSGSEITSGWDKSFDGGNSGNEEARTVAVDSNGNVYVAGDRSTFGESLMWWIKKYDSAGNETTSGWDKTLGISGAGFDIGAYDLVIDSSNNVYIAGTIYNGITTAYDWWIQKFGSDGTAQWTGSGFNVNGGIVFDGGVGIEYYDRAYAITLDRDQNIIVVGTVYQSATNNDWRVASYNSSGSLLWSQTINSSGVVNDTAYGVVASDYYVYVVGELNPEVSDMWLVRFMY